MTRALCRENIEVQVLWRTQPPDALFGAASIDIHLADWTSLTPDHPAFDGADTVLHFISTTTPCSSMEDMPFDVSSSLLPTLNLLKIRYARSMFLNSFSIFPAYAEPCRHGDRPSHFRRVLSECGSRYGTGEQLILGITLDQRAEVEPTITRASRVPFAMASSAVQPITLFQQLYRRVGAHQYHHAKRPDRHRRMDRNTCILRRCWGQICAFLKSSRAFQQSRLELGQRFNRGFLRANNFHCGCASRRRNGASLCVQAKCRPHFHELELAVSRVTGSCWSYFCRTGERGKTPMKSILLLPE